MDEDGDQREDRRLQHTPNQVPQSSDSYASTYVQGDSRVHLGDVHYQYHDYGDEQNTRIPLPSNSYASNYAEGNARVVLGNVHHHHHIHSNTQSTRTLHPSSENDELHNAKSTKDIDPDEISSYDPRYACWLRSQQRLRGTCQWIFKDEKIHKWLDDIGPPILICTGPMGSGKSITASAMVDHLSSEAFQRSDLLAHYFVDASENEPVTAVKIVSALIKQLLLHIRSSSIELSPNAESKLQSLFIGRLFQPSSPLLLKAIQALLDHLKHVVFIIDGLDSLAENELVALFEFVSSVSVYERVTHNRKFMLFSREFLGRGISFRKLPNSTMLRIRTQHVLADVEAYIEYEVDRRQMSNPITENLFIIEKVKQTLKAYSDKMFLWQRFQISALWDPTLITCDEDIRLQLTSLPESLEDHYIRCLRRIETTNTKDSREIASIAFRWIASARKPLTHAQAREAVSMTLYPDNAPCRKSKLLPSSVEEYCANLLVLDNITGIVKFSHPSVKEFLQSDVRLPSDLSKYALSSTEDDLLCGRVCMAYIQQIQVKNQIISQRKTEIRSDLVTPILKSVTGSMFSRFRSKVAVQKPLMLPVPPQTRSISGDYVDSVLRGYIKRNWVSYFKNITPLSSDHPSFAELCLQHDSQFLPWSDSTSKGLEHYQALVSYAVYTDHRALLELTLHYLKTSKPATYRSIVDNPCLGTGSSWLHVAAALGYLDVARLLMLHCDIQSVDENGHTFAMTAAIHGNEHIVPLLLNRSDNTNAGQGLQDSTRQATPSRGHDSGYVSHDSASLDSAIHFSKDEAGSVYSDDTSVASVTQDDFTTRLIELVLLDVAAACQDVKDIDGLLSGMETLLMGFAMRLGQEKSSSRAWRAMVFICKHRRSISAGLKGQAAESLISRWARTTPSEISDIEISDPASDNEEQVTDLKSPLQNESEMSFMEKFDDWTKRNATHSDSSVPDSRFPTEESGEHPDYTVGNIDGNSNEKSALLVYEKLICDSESYRWLISGIRRKLVLTDAIHTSATRIRDAVIALFPGKIRLSKLSPPDQVIVKIALDHNPLTDPRASDLASMSSLLVLNGTAIEVQAMTCREYLEQTWPATGLLLLTFMIEVWTARPGQIVEMSEHPFGATINATLGDSTVMMSVKGTKDFVAEITEQLCWLSAVYSAPPSTNGILYCQPFFSKMQAGESAELTIECRYDATDNTEEPGTCWQGLFQRCVIIEGFPIRRRLQNAPGLEISLGLLSYLMGTAEAHEYAGRRFLKGFSSIAVPTSLHGNELTWHLCYSRTGDYIPYYEHGIADVAIITLEQLESARHIIGWCSKILNLCGSSYTTYPVGMPDSQPDLSPGHLHGLLLSFGQLPTHSNAFSLSEKHVQSPFLNVSITKLYNNLENRFVLFWDARDNRGWLVNGLKALLHLLRYSLKDDEARAGTLYCLREKTLLEPQGSHDDGFARAVLCMKENLDLSITEDGSDECERFRDRMRQFCYVLQKAFDYENDHRDWTRLPRSNLDGWDFVSLTQQLDGIEPSTILLPQQGQCWIDLIRITGAITLLGDGFGELIKPEKDLCETLPVGEFCIAATTTDIKRIMSRKRGFCAFGKSRVICASNSMKLMWHSPEGSCATCGCEDGRQSSKALDSVQVLRPYESTAAVQNPVECIDLVKYVNGAMIFGYGAAPEKHITDVGPPRVQQCLDQSDELEINDNSTVSTSSTNTGATTTGTTLTSLDSSVHDAMVTSKAGVSSMSSYGSSDISGFAIQGNVAGSVTINYLIKEESSRR